jgi:hypothetical protein
LLVVVSMSDAAFPAAWTKPQVLHGRVLPTVSHTASSWPHLYGLAGVEGVHKGQEGVTWDAVLVGKGQSLQ